MQIVEQDEASELAAAFRDFHVRALRIVDAFMHDVLTFFELTQNLAKMRHMIELLEAGHQEAVAAARAARDRIESRLVELELMSGEPPKTKLVVESAWIDFVPSIQTFAINGDRMPGFEIEGRRYRVASVSEFAYPDPMRILDLVAIDPPTN